MALVPLDGEGTGQVTIVMRKEQNSNENLPNVNTGGMHSTAANRFAIFDQFLVRNKI